jgi:hypothetical protein
MSGRLFFPSFAWLLYSFSTPLVSPFGFPCSTAHVDEAESAKAGVAIERIVGRVPVTPEMATRLQNEVFMPLASRVVFKFGHLEWGDGPPPWWGIASHVPHRGLNESYRDTFERIVFHQDYYTIAKRFAQLKTGENVAERLRFNFHTACTFVHEVFHADEMRYATVTKSQRMRNENNYGIEPFMFNGATAELGHAWETYTFGGIVHVLDLHPRGGCFILKKDESRAVVNYMIPMGYIEELQQPDTWKNLLQAQNYDNAATFHVPLVGYRVLAARRD